MTETARQATACSMQDATIAETEVIVPSPKRFVREHLVMPDGYECDWYYVDTPPSVMIVPITAGGDVVMVRQYRHNLKQHMLELPAGTADHGREDLASAARRELAEETGYEPGPGARLEKLGACYSLSSETNKYTHVYSVRPVIRVGEPSGDTEIERYFDMTVVHVPLKQAMAAIGSEIVSCETITALTLAAR